VDVQQLKQVERTVQQLLGVFVKQPGYAQYLLVTLETGHLSGSCRVRFDVNLL
jgi:hypothetical protein